jgi:hypothetical protein
MNRALALLLTALALWLPAVLAAQGYSSGARVVATTSWVEEWDPATGQWVRVDDAPATLSRASHGIAATTTRREGDTLVTETIREEPVRFIAARARPDLQSSGIARFGPFRVLDPAHAALVGATDASSPQAFAAMMAAYPDLKVIEFLDAPGTSHDLANLKLGRAIRNAGLATHVPAGGSARSGAVELFLAGTSRTVDPGAMFAVHSWRDALGREPADFAPDAPENRLYLDYYAEMGMPPDQARAFYAMTNSVPHAGARWMEGAEMARWIAPAPVPALATRTRLIDARLAGDMRDALAQALRLPPRADSRQADGVLDRIATALVLGLTQDEAPKTAPRLAYAAPGAGLLDSWTAFP